MGDRYAKCKFCGRAVLKPGMGKHRKTGICTAVQKHIQLTSEGWLPQREFEHLPKSRNLYSAIGASLWEPPQAKRHRTLDPRRGPSVTRHSAWKSSLWYAPWFVALTKMAPEKDFGDMILKGPDHEDVKYYVALHALMGGE